MVLRKKTNNLKHFSQKCKRIKQLSKKYIKNCLKNNKISVKNTNMRKVLKDGTLLKTMN